MHLFNSRRFIVAKFAEIEKIRLAYCMTAKGLCRILGITPRTYHEWSVEGIPDGSKCHPFLNHFTDNHAEIIKIHAEKSLNPASP